MKTCMKHWCKAPRDGTSRWDNSPPSIIWFSDHQKFDLYFLSSWSDQFTMADSTESSSTVQAILFHNYLHFFAITILYYDHSLTLGSEISHIWRRPKTTGTYWFFLNRYFAFFGNIAVIAVEFTTLRPRTPVADGTLLSCKQYNLFRQLFLVVNQVLVCVLLTLRVYALYGRSLRMLIFMIGSGAILLGVAAWSLVDQRNTPANQASGCHIGLSAETGIHIALAWEALFLYDTLVLCLILFKSYKTRRHQLTFRTSIPIVTIILRDGTIYFVVMALANLSNILTFYFSQPLLKGCLSVFASTMSITMMSRLLLNLHETADVGILTTDSTNTTYLDMFTSHHATTIMGLDSQWTHEADDARPRVEMQDFGARNPRFSWQKPI